MQWSIPLLVVQPFGEFGASGNDINVIDLGVATDRTPIETITGRIDLAGTSGFNGPSNSTECHAAVTGRRYTG